MVEHEGWLRIKASDYWGNGRGLVRIHSRVSFDIRGWRWSRYQHSLMAVVSPSQRLRLGRLANWWVGCGRLRDGSRCAARMGSARGVGCAVRSWDEPQTHSGSGSVALRIRACTGCSDRRWAYRSGGGSAGFLHCLGAGLPGWAGGAVVANKQAQSTSTDRLTTACGRSSRSGHRTDLRKDHGSFWHFRAVPANSLVRQRTVLHRPCPGRWRTGAR